MTENMEQDNLIELTADVVSAYVSNNSIQYRTNGGYRFCLCQQ
jgi:predicted transcriptional regulator